MRGKTIPQGSYLLVESLDRVSRQTVRKAVRTMEDIVAAGITSLICLTAADFTARDTRRRQHGVPDDGHQVHAGDEESAMKSRRLLAAYEAKRESAKDKDVGAPFT